VDTQLVSIVQGLEQEAEQVLLDAKNQAAAIERESVSTGETKAGRTRELAEIEAKKILEQGRLDTEHELAQALSKQKLELEESIRRASTRLDKAAQLVLEELKRS